MTDNTDTPAATLATATRKAALPSARLTLLGTLHGPDRARALLRHGGKVATVSAGDRIGGMTVAAIGEGVVILSDGGTARRLEMPNI